MRTKKKGQWALTPPAKKWVIERIPQYRNLQPPQGLELSEAEGRLRRHGRDWKSFLGDDLMSNFPGWDKREVLGTTWTAEDEALHATVCRIVTSLNNT